MKRNVSNHTCAGFSQHGQCHWNLTSFGKFVFSLLTYLQTHQWAWGGRSLEVRPPTLRLTLLSLCVPWLWRVDSDTNCCYDVFGRHVGFCTHCSAICFAARYATVELKVKETPLSYVRIGQNVIKNIVFTQTSHWRLKAIWYAIEIPDSNINACAILIRSNLPSGDSA